MTSSSRQLSAIIALVILALAVLAYFHSYNMVMGLMTYDECVLKYDVFKCSSRGMDNLLNHTKPTEAELKATLPSYDENPYFWDCIEDYKEEYDFDEATSRDLCKDLLDEPEWVNPR